MHIESICHHYFLDLLMLFYFLTIDKYLYIIHCDLDLFHDIFSAIDQHYQKQIHFLLLILF